MFNVCVNDSVHLLYKLVFKKKLLMMGFGSSFDFLITLCFWCVSVYYKGKKLISVLQ